MLDCGAFIPPNHAEAKMFVFVFAAPCHPGRLVRPAAWGGIRGRWHVLELRAPITAVDGPRLGEILKQAELAGANGSLRERSRARLEPGMGGRQLR